ncbi:MAG: hypothetical protein GY711_10145 [bacterium]|nr:hypothetical protein [bacterium]
MPIARTLFVLAIAAFAASACSRPRSDGACDLEAQLTLTGDSNSVRVRLDFRGVGEAQLELGALLPRRLFGVEDVRLEAPDGRALSQALQFVSVDTGATKSRYPRLTVRSDDGRALRAFTLSYRVDLGSQAVQIPCGEERHIGYVSTDGATLSARNVLLLPDRIATIGFSIEPPRDWTTVARMPRAAQAPSQLDFWKWSLVSGPLVTSRQIGETFVYDFCAPREAVDAVTRCIELIGEYLGPQEAELDVAVMRRAADSKRIESAAGSRIVTIDMDAPDVGSLRELVRLLVPLWVGSARWNEEKVAGGRPLLSGLTEYLAQHIPEDLGYANTSASRSLEYTWMKERTTADISLSDPRYISSRQLELTRRLKAPSIVESVLRESPTLEEKAGVIAAWRAAQFRTAPDLSPSSEEPALAQVSALLHGRAGHLAFEDEWTPQVVRVQPLDEGSIARRLQLAYTANSAGYLENCGCKITQDGGVARRATALAELRTEHADLLVLDIGNFAPTERNSSTITDSVSSEFEVYLDAMELMQYDAVGIGTYEMLVGTEWILEHLAGRPFDIVSSVRTRDDDLPLPAYAVLDHPQGRIGVVALWEKLDHGWLHETQERNTWEVRYPSGIAAIEEALERATEEAELVVVAGFVTPPTLQELADSGAVDVVLNALGDPKALGMKFVNRIGGMLVVNDAASSYGVNHLELQFDSAGTLAGAVLASVRLDDSVAKDETIRMMLEGFHAESAAQTGAASLQPLFGWDDWAGGEYIGHETCATCHSGQHKQWRTTPHAYAMQTLRKIRRDRNAKCVQCHVLGLGRADGFEIARPDPGLEGVQCETCHGSGAEHAAMPRKDNIRLTPSKQVCLECHDKEHSDLLEGDFEQILQRVSHGPSSSTR